MNWNSLAYRLWVSGKFQWVFAGRAHTCYADLQFSLFLYDKKFVCGYTVLVIALLCWQIATTLTLANQPYYPPNPSPLLIPSPCLRRQLVADIQTNFQSICRICHLPFAIWNVEFVFAVCNRFNCVAHLMDFACTVSVFRLRQEDSLQVQQPEGRQPKQVRPKALTWSTLLIKSWDSKNQEAKQRRYIYEIWPASFAIWYEIRTHSNGRYW